MDMREINTEIARLEGSETTYPNCNKLAMLYTVKDHLDEPRQEPTPRMARAEYSSEFLSVVSGAPIEGVLRIIDEHMECVRVLYPKEYSAIIEKILDL